MGRLGESGMNDFQECLAFSHAAEELPFWLDVYRDAFPDMTACISHRQDGEHQRAGIDRSIILENSKQLLIDEKVRGRNKITGRVYDDIALEYISNDRNNTPGWVVKPLRCDYIAYAIAPLGRCYLLPVIQLQQAFKKNAKNWLNSYPTIKAKNEYYNTHSVCVPPGVLFREIGKELRVSFNPFEIGDFNAN